jgi:hypothetical protein
MIVPLQKDPDEIISRIMADAATITKKGRVDSRPYE